MSSRFDRPSDKIYNFETIQNENS
nr:unnamed protein product [Callosobruchus analis]